MIGFDARSLCVPDPGGAARTGLQLLLHLSEFHADYIAFGPSSLETKVANIPVDSSYFWFNSRFYGLVWEQLWLSRQAKLRNVDVVYSPNSMMPLYRHDPKFIVTIHDVGALEGYSSSMYRQFERLKLPRVCEQAAKIVTVSEFSKEQIQYHLNVPSSKIEVVYNGVSEIFLSDNPGTAFSLPNNYILYVGSPTRRKNIQGILRSFRILEERVDGQLDLVLIGPEDIPTSASISIGDDKRVTQLGFVSDEELKYAYSNAEIFLFPSRYEGFGLPPLEAMACGTPVVAAETSSLPEILGDAAMFVDPEDHAQIADSIERILRNDDLARELANRGRKRASEFTWDESAERLHNILTSIAQ